MTHEPNRYPKPGDLFRAPFMDTEDREAWCVILPNGSPWYTTQMAEDPTTKELKPWKVTGEPPNITVEPSINDLDPNNPWHGHITNGEMTNA